MKNFIKNMKNGIADTSRKIAAQVKATRYALTDPTAETYVDTGVKIIIAVVIVFSKINGQNYSRGGSRTIWIPTGGGFGGGGFRGGSSGGFGGFGGGSFGGGGASGSW